MLGKEIMQDTIEELMEKIQVLEKSLWSEIQKKEKEFYYEINRKKVQFEREVRAQHKLLVEKIHRYLYHSSALNILTAPVIWFCLIPTVFMDIAVTIYQTVCFPVYGIPKVRRSDYVIVDRNYLGYLNFIEKLNCMYCGYFNGVVAYFQEVGARTEQHWCPIKHARKLKVVHSRYKNFLDYGDGVGYRKKFATVRRQFEDLSPKADPQDKG